jgi:prophage antirepressor-like protein
LKEAGDLRVLNDKGKPYLYPADLFAVIDPQRPSDSVTAFGADGEANSHPDSLSQPGFFKSFFDQNPREQMRFPA